MKILVCVKQVPGSNNVEVDPDTGVLLRSRTDNKMNPYDLFAIETALNLRSLYGGKVSIMAMGPPQAREVIEEAVYMGADDGFLLTDAGFAGSDVLATSYALSQGIQIAGNYDLFLCGKQTTDGDTAQVGPEISEFLQIPHITNVSSITNIHGCFIELEANLDDWIVKYKIETPCLLCVDSEINTPRLPSFRRQMELENLPITTFSIADLHDQDLTHYGIHGSPTQVERIFPPEKNREKIIREGSGEELAEFLYGYLLNRKFIKEVNR